MADVLDSDGRDVREAVTGVALRVRGLVQGVGFRPTVWRLADLHGLSGDVRNDGEGVLIRAWGSPADLAGFEQALIAEPPPLARIDAIERTALEEPAPRRGFVIAESVTGRIATGIVPDAATCPACLAEVLDPGNRRYRYPFTNCTHCGPRLSIVSGIPYDRANTAMAAFPMCPDCRREYEDPADRRFHAEPNACPACGPRVWLEDAEGREIGLEAVGSSLRSTRPTEARIVGQVERSDDPKTTPADAIAAAAEMIRAGCILAIKGIGGFHLACDAGSEAAVAELRRRKRRYHKPFALMARDVAMLRSYAVVNPQEEALLASPAAPIVVLDQVRGGPAFASGLAPGQTCLGFMLPYTPLHHLLMRGLDRPIVLTSGNLSEEPQAVDNAEARLRLVGIADLWLMHDRAILNRLDDSVARVLDGAPAILRRARGYAPAPLLMPDGFQHHPPVLAMGGELKSTFCCLGEGRAVVSQHIGDLEDVATHADYRAALGLYRRLNGFEPEIIAVDAHPDYLSTQWGIALAAETGGRLARVLHHHAHIAAVLAEHGQPLDAPPVLGIALDGLGMGEHGELWGGEFLLADYRSARRVGSLAALPLIGGERAMREPWRNAFAHLDRFIGWEEVHCRYGSSLPIASLLASKQPAILARMVAGGINAPSASSAGRLFDAAAAILGVCAESVSYEGQSAVELEAIANPHMTGEPVGYPFDIDRSNVIPRLSWRPLWQGMLDDMLRGTDRAVIAARFHRGIIDAVAGLARELCEARGLSQVALSGGVLQNRILLEGLATALRGHKLEVLAHRLLPSNDGGLSLGQAAIAAGMAAR